MGLIAFKSTQLTQNERGHLVHTKRRPPASFADALQDVHLCKGHVVEGNGLRVVFSLPLG
jgi:hypothetical protein